MVPCLVGPEAIPRSPHPRRVRHLLSFCHEGMMLVWNIVALWMMWFASTTPLRMPVCKTCVGPRFAWDTMPIAFHCSEPSTGPTGAFSEAALDTIAKFPLVTIEKWQGMSAPVFLWEEDAMVAAARGIKGRDPNITVIVWFDSLRIYTGWSYPPKHPFAVNHTFNPDALFECSFGHLRAAEFLETHPEYLAMNTSGQKAIEGFGHCHIYDFTKQLVRDYWRDHCINMTKSGVIDGCGADASAHRAVESNKSRTAQYGFSFEQGLAWDNGRRTSLRSTMVGLGDGLLLGKDPSELLVDNPYVNGVFHEGCSADNETINALRILAARANSTGQRLVYECHADCVSAGTSKTHAEDCLHQAAAFLVGAGEYHYFVVGGWRDGSGDVGNFASHYIPELFDRPLGKPLADAVYNTGTRMWTRAFASGTAVQFDVGTCKGKIMWAD